MSIWLFVLSVIASILGGIILVLIQPGILTLACKYLNMLGLDPYFKIIASKKTKKIFNNVLCPKITDEEFSTLADMYLTLSKNEQCIITNIQEPVWFYQHFEIHGNSLVKKYLNRFKNAFELKDYNKAESILGDFIKKYYEDVEFDDLFKHLISTYQCKKKGIETIRLNFFNLDTNDKLSKDRFIAMNKDFHVYFFEKFINYQIPSYYKRIVNGSFRGTDALILNRKVILNYDDTIQQLSYQNNKQDDLLNGGFFPDIIEKILKQDRCLKPTKTILKNVYNIHLA